MLPKVVLNMNENEQNNIGCICTRLQCERGLGDKTAFRWISAHQEKTAEQFFSFLGVLKVPVICGTLFTNFGDNTLIDKLRAAKANGIVTNHPQQENQLTQDD